MGLPFVTRLAQIVESVRRFARAPSMRGLYDAVASSTVGLVGGYQVLDPRRKILPRGLYWRSVSANELATMSLPQLRALCRKLERDNPTARAAVEGFVAQVVGTGIALEPDHGDETINDRIRTVWRDLIRGCDVSGKRSIYDIQTQSCREWFVAGEFLWRTPVLQERAAQGLCPLVIQCLECEWIAPIVPAPPADGITMVAGIELNRWAIPVAYNLQNPETAFGQQIERVPASEIVHEFERRRSLQARGEPVLAPVVERIWQEGDLVDAELRSAVNCAALAIVVTSAGGPGPVDTTQQGTVEDPAQQIGVGSIARLPLGDKVEAFQHNRPSQPIVQFRDTIRGDIAAGCRIPKTYLDKDYSKANYSSMRAAMLDNERLIAPVREWFGHSTIGAYYLRCLPYLCLMAGVKMPKRIHYRLIPDVMPYVDPYKDIQAAAMAVAGGFTTHEAEIGKRGGDIRQVWEQLAREKALATKLGLHLDLSGTNAPAPDSTTGVSETAPAGAGNF